MSASIVAALQSQGWNYVPAEKASTSWVPSRYGSLPLDLTQFLESFSRLHNATETRWFLAADEFRRERTEGFAWNEFERMSIKAAAGDSDWLLEIESFWADHIPIFMSVEGFYSYAAYCCAGENYGCYVSGSEPEFEEAKVVARDLSGFLAWVSHELNT